MHLQMDDKELLSFRTKKCVKKQCDFGARHCEILRRCPFYVSRIDNCDLRYVPVPCPYMFHLNGMGCKNGERCPFAHSFEEINYHPIVYKTFPCDGKPAECALIYDKQEVLATRCSDQGGSCWRYHGAADRRIITTHQYRLPFTSGMFIHSFASILRVVSLQDSNVLDSAPPTSSSDPLESPCTRPLVPVTLKTSPDGVHAPVTHHTFHPYLVDVKSIEAAVKEDEEIHDQIKKFTNTQSELTFTDTPSGLILRGLQPTTADESLRKHALSVVASFIRVLNSSVVAPLTTAGAPMKAKVAGIMQKSTSTQLNSGTVSNDTENYNQQQYTSNANDFSITKVSHTQNLNKELSTCVRANNNKKNSHNSTNFNINNAFNETKGSSNAIRTKANPTVLEKKESFSSDAVSDPSLYGGVSNFNQIDHECHHHNNDFSNNHFFMKDFNHQTDSSEIKINYDYYPKNIHDSMFTYNNASLPISADIRHEAGQSFFSNNTVDNNNSDTIATTPQSLSYVNPLQTPQSLNNNNNSHVNGSSVFQSKIPPVSSNPFDFVSNNVNNNNNQKKIRLPPSTIPPPLSFVLPQPSFRAASNVAASSCMHASLNNVQSEYGSRSMIAANNRQVTANSSFSHFASYHCRNHKDFLLPNANEQQQQQQQQQHSTPNKYSMKNNSLHNDMYNNAVSTTPSIDGECGLMNDNQTRPNFYHFTTPQSMKLSYSIKNSPYQQQFDNFSLPDPSDHSLFPKPSSSVEHFLNNNSYNYHHHAMASTPPSTSFIIPASNFMSISPSLPPHANPSSTTPNPSYIRNKNCNSGSMTTGVLPSSTFSFSFSQQQQSSASNRVAQQPQYNSQVNAGGSHTLALNHTNQHQHLSSGVTSAASSSFLSNFNANNAFVDNKNNMLSSHVIPLSTASVMISDERISNTQKSLCDPFVNSSNVESINNKTIATVNGVKVDLPNNLNSSLKVNTVVNTPALITEQNTTNDMKINSTNINNHTSQPFNSDIHPTASTTSGRMLNETNKESDMVKAVNNNPTIFTNNNTITSDQTSTFFSHFNQMSIDAHRPPSLSPSFYEEEPHYLNNSLSFNSSLCPQLLTPFSLTNNNNKNSATGQNKFSCSSTPFIQSNFNSQYINNQNNNGTNLLVQKSLQQSPQPPPSNFPSMTFTDSYVSPPIFEEVSPQSVCFINNNENNSNISFKGFMFDENINAVAGGGCQISSSSINTCENWQGDATITSSMTGILNYHHHPLTPGYSTNTCISPSVVVNSPQPYNIATSTPNAPDHQHTPRETNIHH